MTYYDERRKKLVSILALVLVVLVAVAGYAYWDLTGASSNSRGGNFGAIAVSSSSLDYGTAWGYRSASLAGERATSECNARVKNHDCAVRLNLAATCGAMVMSAATNHVFLASDKDRMAAHALALAQCQAGGRGDCVVRENFCAAGP